MFRAIDSSFVRKTNVNHTHQEMPANVLTKEGPIALFITILR